MMITLLIMFCVTVKKIQHKIIQYKQKITDETDADGSKDINMMVPLKYLGLNIVLYLLLLQFKQQYLQ